MPQHTHENIALDFKVEINLLKQKIKAKNADNEAISGLPFVGNFNQNSNL